VIATTVLIGAALGRQNRQPSPQSGVEKCDRSGEDWISFRTSVMTQFLSRKTSHHTWCAPAFAIPHARRGISSAV
jgi:hypothetical protein